ncbi:tripartite tricarboxylate transporter substrate binding protein (plasmid) [Cupriavidus oxalaticus]|uniref:Tripartite tricarboxylate transporter substrate binding protein n=2 Tax=Cupriavidus oxalaticus TaxID=96344 RepID=A0A4P7LG78_9BURK|nr:tripartite tricarboxylate transporter substrate binding protein [Cupriavidus oxalaticus]
MLSILAIGRLLFAMLVTALPIIPLAAHAQPYPARPVRIIVPFPAGGGTDVIARSLGDELSRGMGKPFIVENKPGAGSVMGNDLVAKSSADGYTLLLTTSAFSIVASIGIKLPYGGIQAFEPVALLGRAPNVVLVRNDSRIRSAADLLRDAKANPGKLTYGSAGNGTSVHLAAEYFQSLAGIRLVHVPYRGSAPQFADLLAGHIDVAFATMASAATLIRDGRVRALAVTSPARSPAFPEVPAVAEAGVKGYSAEVWYGVFVPKGTPATVVAALHRAIAQASAGGAFRERLAREGVVGGIGSPQDLCATAEQEVSRWLQVVKDKEIRIE